MIVIAIGIGSEVQADGPQGRVSAEASAFFEAKVRPVLVDQCVKCHGPVKQSGGLRLDSRAAILEGGDAGPAVVVGEPDKSPMVLAARHQGELKMPPKGPLPGPVVDSIAEWVRMGAPWPDNPSPTTGANNASTAGPHWSLRPVVDHAPPRVEHSDLVASPVDAFVLARLEASQLEPSPATDRRTLIRRATFDLTGLPPTPSEVDAFLADNAPNAFARVVDRLLASPRYGEAWGRHWLDVARYADTKGYVFTEERRYPYAYTYRDYVIRSFNEDKPYDRFLIEQVAADRLPLGDDKRALAALGFLTVGRRFLNDVNEIIDDRIDVVTRGLMGLSVTCARCHDHKFDPIPTEDYYSLHGVFASSVEPTDLPPLPDPVPEQDKADYDREHQARVDKVAAEKADHKAKIEAELRDHLTAFVEASVELNFEPKDSPLENVARAHKLSPERVRFAARRLKKTFEVTKDHDPVFGPWRAFSAIPPAEFEPRAAELAEKLVEEPDPGRPVDPIVLKMFEGDPPKTLLEVARRYGELLQRAAKGDAADPALRPIRDRLAADGGLLTIPPDALMRVLDRAERDHLQATQKTVSELDVTHPGSPARAMVLNDAPHPTNPHVFIRGNPGRPGKPVPRRFLRALAPAGSEAKAFADGSGRLELALAIASPDNPLTARVMVNRIWHHHFGAGLVTTPSDFGVRGEPPSHPELLDFLARRFIDGGWSVKAIHRLILLSTTYQQKSDRRDDGFAADPTNRLLWRQNRRRLDFESTRDAVLAVAGQLDLRMGGRPVELFDVKSPSIRRTIYGSVDRYDLDATFRTFDFPSPDISAPMRPITTVPQQALFLMNSPFLLDQSRALARRTDLPAASELEPRIARLYLELLGRPAEPHEGDLGRRFLESRPKPAGDKAPGPWEEYAQVLMMTNEFVFVD